MSSAIWYALILLLHILAPAGNVTLPAEVYIDSVPVASLEIRGDMRSGELHGEPGLIGEYESSRRYRQSYQLFPRFDVLSAVTEGIDEEDHQQSMGDTRAMGQTAGGNAPSSQGVENPAGLAPADAPATTLRYASGELPPLSVDLTPVMSAITVPEIGRQVSFTQTGYEELFSGSGDSEQMAPEGVRSSAESPNRWIIRRSSSQISLAAPHLGLLVIVRF